MSYILDALRKAERERAQNVTADASWQAPPSTVRSGPGQYRPLLLGVLCLLLVVALIITAVHDRSAAAARAAAEAAAPAAVETAPAQTSSGIDDTAMSLQQQNPATLDDVVERGADEATPAPDETAALSAMVVHRDPAPPAAGASDDASAPEPPAVAAPAETPPDPPPATEVEQVKLQPAPAPQIPKLRDMPADYRDAFPALTLDVHVYDSAPRKRFIMIAGKRYNEGDSLSSGPRVVQVVPEGVVFEFRGEQVLFTIAH